MVKDFAGAEERALLVLVQEVLKETSSKKVLDQVQDAFSRGVGRIWPRFKKGAGPGPRHRHH